MTGLNHAATGIVIALVTKRPELALPLAFASHFVLDAVPHSAVAHRKSIMAPYLILEACAAITLTIACMLAFPEYWLLIGASAVAAYLPDLLWPFHYGYPINLRDAPIFKQFYWFHHTIQWAESYRGWLVEVLYFSVLAIFLTTYHP